MDGKWEANAIQKWANNKIGFEGIQETLANAND